jgi:hypothetical protein
MKRWGYLLTFVSGAFLAVVLGLTTSVTFKASNVAAQPTEKASGQKWEYCSVGKGFYASEGIGRVGWRAPIYYFQPGGGRYEMVELQAEIGRRSSDWGEDARANAIAKLGNEGWEMVGIEVTGETSSSVAYVFKRLKQ